VASLPHLPRAREIDAASACEFLTRQNFPYVSHVVGGISAWIQGGYGRSTGSP
jgi:rhodanese-related sulfurtransferase